jgi:hypothetical protein
MGSITLKGPMFLYRSFELLADLVLPEEVTGLHTVTKSSGLYCTTRWWVSALSFLFVASSSLATMTVWCTAFCSSFFSPM